MNPCHGSHQAPIDREKVREAARRAGPIEVFTARKIITMDPGWPTGTAVAVRNGRIVSVGTMADLEPWLRDCEYTVNDTFKDKVLVPGFIDPHMHPLLGGTTTGLPCIAYYDQPDPYGKPHKGLKTRESVYQRMRELLAAQPADAPPLLCWGYDVIAMGGHLDRRLLDQHVSSERPVAVWDASEHFVYGNTPMLRWAGVTSQACKECFGGGAQLHEDGEPSGAFLGTHAVGLLLRPMMKHLVSPANAFRAVKRMVDLSLQSGLTTISELGIGFVDCKNELNLYPRVFNDPACPMRCVGVLMADIFTQSMHGGDVGAAVAHARKLRKEESTDKFAINGVKFMTDDAFVGLQMQLSDAPGYIDGHKGLWLSEPGEAYVRKVFPWWKAGEQIHVHSNGDAAQDATLEVLAELQLRHPRFDHRFTFEHYGVSTTAQARRLKALGGCASVNIFYPHLRGELNESHLGCDRAHLASRLGTLVATGVPTTTHTDTPIAPPRPLEEMWVAVNRTGQSGKVLAPHERVTVYQAMRMKTVDAAFMLGMDHLIGSIEAGKLADFTVLAQDPFEVPPEQLKDIEVWGTVVGGKVHPVTDVRWTLTDQKPAADAPAAKRPRL
eukprot:TRINITY_DN55249_c0_g1_i1.p1 TRINITY_DN55249_c0_g1~~TRINITY_DN55249_c0_g1_i1.p1  ORF type:complete len:642 (+),score=184.37 TRINITY_DN55249_c0_g1_i1:100-1926(+)